MSQKTKSIILIVSFAVFFSVSYLVIIYAFGWQFDFKTFKWQETGGILVKTNTDAVRVFINDELKGKTSFLSNTFIQKNLLPGQYALLFKKDKLPEISKNIKIKSGEAGQLIHLYLTDADEIAEFIANSEPKKENPDYFINKKDGLLYRQSEDEKIEKISSESVYIKDYRLKVLQKNIYLASSDGDAPGVFLLEQGLWKQIHSLPANDLIISPDNKKLAIIESYEITVLWLKDENEAPYFEKDHKEIIKIGEKIKEALWFKTSWHLIYITESGQTRFLEIDPTGGRSDILI